jgi:hypothetical protein
MRRKTSRILPPLSAACPMRMKYDTGVRGPGIFVIFSIFLPARKEHTLFDLF